MKSLKNIMAAIILLLSAQNTFSQLTKVEIIATGLTCSMCSNAINKQLKTLADVEKVDVDLNTNTFIVFLKNNNQITPKTIKDKVENAGFFVGEMILFLSFDNQKVTDSAIVKNDKLSFIFIDSKNIFLNGETKLKVYEKSYLTTKTFKRIAKLLKHHANDDVEKENIYHVKII